MRYSKIIFCCVIFLGLCYNIQSQNIGPLTLDNQSCFYYYSSPITVAPPSQPVSLTIGDGNYEIYSNGSVTMLPGFVAMAPVTANGFYVAAHGTDLPEPELFGLDLNNVVQYDKMEVGISLNSLDARIDEFLTDNLGDYKVASASYNTAYANGDILNPYDPQHISIEARFYNGTSTVPIVRYGFFYKEYHRTIITPTPPNTQTNNWAPTNSPETSIDPFEWRIRFSPPEIGSWKCMILIYVDGELIPEHYFFKFNVIEGLDPGFVEICDNNQYLKFSNHYDSEDDQFFPVGDNYCFNMDHQGDGNCFALNCHGNLDDHRIKPDLFVDNEEYIDKLIGGTNGGGNVTRVIFAPWAFEIEYEKLGNYQTRQIEMFELDEYLKYATDNNVYLSISPLNGYMLRQNGAGLPEYSNYWPWNPYNINHIPGHISGYDPTRDPYDQFKGIDGVDDPIEFFTDPIAKQMFKNKLRYMDARWGYSTHYYCTEISTEIDQHLDNKDFWAAPSNNINSVNWVAEMADYLKNDLKVKQLLTANYGITPRTIDPAGGSNTNSSMWNSSNLDIVSIHDYNDKLGNLGMKSDVVKNSLNTFSRPAFICENDVWRWAPITQCTGLSIHNNLWASAFSCSYGPGLHWEWRTDLDFSNEYKALRDLFSYVLLTYEDGYIPFHEINYTAFENFCMTKSSSAGSNKAYGWVHNRSFNEYTVGGCMDTIMINEDNDTSNHSKLRTQYVNYWHDESYNFFFPIMYQSEYKPYSTFRIPNLIPGATYILEYYYTSGPHIGEFDPNLNFTFTTSTNPMGGGYYTIFNGPPTGGGLNPYTNEPYPADWAYLVHLSNEPRSVVNNQQWDPLENEDEVIKVENNNGLIENISVAPNPNDGTFTVTAYSKETASRNFSLMDVSGNVLQNKLIQLNEGTNRIQFSNSTLASGVYFIRVDGYTELLKVVISH